MTACLGHLIIKPYRLSHRLSANLLWDCPVIVLKYFLSKHLNTVILESCGPKRGGSSSGQSDGDPMQWETKQNEESALNPNGTASEYLFLWRLPWIIARAVCRSLYIVSSCLWVGWGGVFTSGKRDWPRLTWTACFKAFLWNCLQTELPAENCLGGCSTLRKLKIN